MSKMTEGTDYELIPADQIENDQAWDVRLLSGDFIETVVRYGRIKFDGIRDCLTFDFKVVYSPVDGVTPDDVELQEHAADVLESILDDAVAKGTLVTGDDVSGNEPRTTDTEELTDE